MMLPRYRSSTLWVSRLGILVRAGTVLTAIIPGCFPSLCIISLVIRTKAFNLWRIFRIRQRLGMSAGNKVRGAKYAWQRRTAPIHIYIILQIERKDVRHFTSTIKSTRICKSTTYHLPPLEDLILRMCWEGEEHVPPSRKVAAVDVELLCWRSLFPSTAMDHFFLDTQSQNLHELWEAGFYTSSSQRPQPLLQLRN